MASEEPDDLHLTVYSILERMGTLRDIPTEA